MSNKYSEKEMADVFEKSLKSNLFSEFPIFKSVFREVSCQQGIPDFISVSGIGIDNLKKYIISSSNVSINSSSLILSILKPKSPRTIKYLVKTSGLKKNTVVSVLRELKKENKVYEDNNGNFILGKSWNDPNIELWTFELKLNNWKRALFQTLQYKAFSHKVIAVFPYSKKKLIINNLNNFKKFRIGIMVFNPLEVQYELLLKPYKNSPSSKRHNFYAMSKIANELANK